MKCNHCSSRVERSDWFCPNCRRSLRSVRGSDQAIGGWRRVPLLTAVGTVAALLAVGTVVGIRLVPGHEPDAESDAVSVSVQERIVVAGGAGARLAPEAPTPPKRSEPEFRTAPAFRAASRMRSETPAPSRPAEPTGAVSVMTDPPIPTFVYLNGGSLLGEAPLRNAAIPAGRHTLGRHTLVFWAPSVGGRSIRTVNVAPGASLQVVEKLRLQDHFGETAPASYPTSGAEPG
jgi:hypothetical protein